MSSGVAVGVGVGVISGVAVGSADSVGSGVGVAVGVLIPPGRTSVPSVVLFPPVVLAVGAGVIGATHAFLLSFQYQPAGNPASWQVTTVETGAVGAGVVGFDAGAGVAVGAEVGGAVGSEVGGVVGSGFGLLPV